MFPKRVFGFACAAQSSVAIDWTHPAATPLIAGKSSRSMVGKVRHIGDRVENNSTSIGAGKRRSSRRYPPSRDRSCTCAPDRAWKTSTVCRSWARPRLAAVRSATCCAALRLRCVAGPGLAARINGSAVATFVTRIQARWAAVCEQTAERERSLPGQRVGQTARRIVKGSAEPDRADRS
jgi:hypothetical protein